MLEVCVEVCLEICWNDEFCEFGEEKNLQHKKVLRIHIAWIIDIIKKLGLMLKSAFNFQKNLYHATVIALSLSYCHVSRLQQQQSILIPATSKRLQTIAFLQLTVW